MYRLVPSSLSDTGEIRQQLACSPTERIGQPTVVTYHCTGWVSAVYLIQVRYDSSFPQQNGLVNRLSSPINVPVGSELFIWYRWDTTAACVFHNGTDLSTDCRHLSMYRLGPSSLSDTGEIRQQLSTTERIGQPTVVTYQCTGWFRVVYLIQVRYDSSLRVPQRNGLVVPSRVGHFNVSRTVSVVSLGLVC